jgi:hypothetical protein
LAAHILEVIQKPEGTEGDHAAYTLVGRGALLSELSALVSLESGLALIHHGSPSAAGLGGELLATLPDVIARLGISGLVQLADHDIVAVRAGAHALLSSPDAHIEEHADVLFALVESRWDDTREVAIGILRDRIDVRAQFGVEGLIGLCDSNRVDVQNLGRTLLTESLDEFDPAMVLSRIAEHPHRNMQRFALELAEGYLEDGDVDALAAIERFMRSVLFDLWPSRDLKWRVVALLAERGQQDARQAGIAAAVLDDFVRTLGRADFDRALQALVQIGLAFPEVGSSVSLVNKSEGAAT